MKIFSPSSIEPRDEFLWCPVKGEYYGKPWKEFTTKGLQFALKANTSGMRPDHCMAISNEINRRKGECK